MAYSKIALAGVGTLGKPILKALLAANYDVTVLTREGSSAPLPSGVHTAKVDYTSKDSLKQALTGQDVLISTITTSAIEAQAALISAAIEAGVKRILPSEFGCDTKFEPNRKLPVFGQKLAVQEQIEAETKGTETTYTYVANNIFTDWGVSNGFIVDIKGKKIELYDGGETEWSTTPLDGVGSAVVGILKHPEETKNRLVRIHGAVLSQKKVLELAQDVVGSEGWTVTNSSAVDVDRDAFEALQKNPANSMAWAIPMLKLANFGKEHEPQFVENDNELLGVPQLTDTEIKAYIKAAA